MSSTNLSAVESNPALIRPGKGTLTNPSLHPQPPSLAPVPAFASPLPSARLGSDSALQRSDRSSSRAEARLDESPPAVDVVVPGDLPRSRPASSPGTSRRPFNYGNDPMTGENDRQVDRDTDDDEDTEGGTEDDDDDDEYDLHEDEDDDGLLQSETDEEEDRQSGGGGTAPPPDGTNGPGPGGDQQPDAAQARRTDTEGGQASGTGAESGQARPYAHMSFSRLESVISDVAAATTTGSGAASDPAGLPGAPATASASTTTSGGEPRTGHTSRVSCSTGVSRWNAATAAAGNGGDRRTSTVDRGVSRGRSASRRGLSELRQSKMASFEQVDEEAEILALKQSKVMAEARSADPLFTLLHLVALHGCPRLHEALLLDSRREQHRYACVARCLVGRHRHPVDEADKYGCTPLIIAAAVGNTDMVRALLEPFGLKSNGRRLLECTDKGYSYINRQDDQIRFSALHAAVSHEKHDTVILLLKYGANPQVLDVTRSTAFMVSPSLPALQRLLLLTLRYEDQIPRPVLLQLMADMVAAQDTYQAAHMWSKALAFVSFKSGDDSMRFGSVANELLGGGMDVEVIIKRYYHQLYKKKRHDTILEYVQLAIRGNHAKLTEIMVDLICAECPDVLTAPKWHELLEPLVCSYPALFHRLLSKLQDMRDEDVRGFVRCLSPARFQGGQGELPRAGAAAASQRLGGGSSRTHAADRVKLLIYQQLVEGLKKVSYRVVKTFFEESDQRLLNDMAQFPIFADFVGIIANMQTAKAFDESDGCRQLLLEFLQSLCGLPEGACDDAPTTPLSLPTTPPPPSPAPWQPGARPSVAWQDQGSNAGATALTATATVTPTVRAANGTRVQPVINPSRTMSSAAGGGGGGGRAGFAGAAATAAATPTAGGGSGGNYRSGIPNSGLGSARSAQDAADRWTRQSLQTLNVRRVLSAALGAGKADNVEATVAAIVGWVATNSGGCKAIFLSGITADMVKELATRFPSSCAVLLNLVSKDVLQQLTTLQVPASVLYNREHLIKCSHVHNHFTWREQELRRLREMEGYDEHVVDALVDFGVPFECIYKAAVEMGAGPLEGATPEHFAKLIEHKFSGPDLKLLISNGIQLSRIIHHIEECGKPLPTGPEMSKDYRDKLDVPMAVLLRDMLRERLTPLIVDIILHEAGGKMFDTTFYNNFRKGRDLREVFPEPLFVPKYTHHFVQMLLIQWRRGTKGREPRAPWAKEFIDTVFEPNDPLCTKLKGAYDNKLTDTHVYIQDDSTAGAPDESQPSLELRRNQANQERDQALQEWEAEHQRQRRHLKQLLRIFISDHFLVHRWPVCLAAWLLLLLLGCLQTYWVRLEDKYHREKARRLGHAVSPVHKARIGTIDAAVLVLPLLGFFHCGRGDMLNALVDSDAPSSWYHYALVRALYSVHWSQFGRVMILLSAAAQLQFALVFLTFFLLVLNCRWAGDPDHPGHHLADKGYVLALLCMAAVLSASMMLERLKENSVPQLAPWVRFGRGLELCCHALVWTVAGIVWWGRGDDLVPALSGVTMLLFVARLTLYGLVTEKLSTAVLALMEILSDSRYFFLLIATVYAGFVLAVAGLREESQSASRVYASRLFTVLLGDFPSTQLTDERGVWRYADISLVLLSIYGVIMLIIFMNLLIATMNDTYDRVKEFCEVEVMRLRCHMMVFVKDFMERHGGMKALATLDGDVLHLLLRPEAVKSSRLLPLGGESEAPEAAAWVGRIAYLRSSIVQELDGVLSQHKEAQADEIARRVAQRDQDLAAAVADQNAALSRRIERLEAAVAEMPSGEALAALSQQLERLGQGVAAVMALGSVPATPRLPTASLA